MEYKKCPICGKPTSNFYGKYREDGLCREHKDMLKDGLIYQCKNCGKWHKINDSCECKNNNENKNVELTCITCGEDSNGKHFCKSCYNKYKNKIVLIKIHKCEFPVGEPLDESYEGVYECEDGHIVKSIAEQTIDNWLFEKGIPHGYEIPIDVGDEKPLKPDFCLKNYLGNDEDLYIEYLGLEGQPKYDEKTKYKVEKYIEKRLTVIFLHPKDSSNLRFTLKSKIIENKTKLEIHKMNYLE